MATCCLQHRINSAHPLGHQPLPCQCTQRHAHFSDEQPTCASAWSSHRLPLRICCLVPTAGFLACRGCSTNSGAEGPLDRLTGTLQAKDTGNAHYVHSNCHLATPCGGRKTDAYCQSGAAFMLPNVLAHSQPCPALCLNRPSQTPPPCCLTAPRSPPLCAAAPRGRSPAC